MMLSRLTEWVAAGQSRSYYGDEPTLLRTA